MMSEFTTTILGVMQLFPPSIPASVIIMAAAVSMSIGIVHCGCCGKKKGKQFKKGKRMKKVPNKKFGRKEGVTVPNTIMQPSPKKKKGKVAAGKKINKRKPPAKLQKANQPVHVGIEVPLTVEWPNAPAPDQEEEEEWQQEDPKQQQQQPEAEDDAFAAPAMTAPEGQMEEKEQTRQDMAQPGDIQYTTLADLDSDAIFEGNMQPKPHDADDEEY